MYLNNCFINGTLCTEISPKVNHFCSENSHSKASRLFFASVCINIFHFWKNEIPISMEPEGPTLIFFIRRMSEKVSTYAQLEVWGESPHAVFNWKKCHFQAKVWIAVQKFIRGFVLYRQHCSHDWVCTVYRQTRVDI